MRLCQSCKKTRVRGHFNRKWCRPCALDRRVRPKSTLTAEQRAFVLEHRGEISGREMAKELGTSWSNVMRFARDRGLSLATLSGSRKWKMQPKVVRKVLDYYFKHGKPATEKAFPGLSVKSIVDRPEYYGVKRKYRQTRWTDAEIVLAAKMAGLVDGKRQARIFKRPNANEGSIKSLWMKRFGHGGGNIHGMSEWMARELLTPGYPLLKTSCWAPRKGSKKKHFQRGIVLWVDMEKRLLSDVPDFIREGVSTLAEFQRWLFKTNDPRPEIRRMVRGDK